MAARKEEIMYMSNDDRLTIVETTLSTMGATLIDIKQDMKRQFDALDKRMDKMDERFDKIDERFDKIDEKFERIDEKFEKIDEKFERIDEKFEKIDEQFEKIGEKFERIDEKFDKMNERFEKNFQFLIDRAWSGFLWIISVMIGLAGLIAHAQHWI